MSSTFDSSGGDFESRPSSWTSPSVQCSPRVQEASWKLSLSPSSLASAVSNFSVTKGGSESIDQCQSGSACKTPEEQRAPGEEETAKINKLVGLIARRRDEAADDFKLEDISSAMYRSIIDELPWAEIGFGDKKWPYLSFDPSSETVWYRSTPNASHEQVVDYVTDALKGAIKACSDGFQAVVECMGSPTQPLSGQPQQSALSDYCCFTEDRLMTVFEVGETDSITDLEACAKKWIEGTSSVIAVVLIKFTESPAWQLDPNIDWKRREWKKLKDSQSAGRDLMLPLEEEPDHGPITIHGSSFWNSLSHASMQYWVRRGKTPKKRATWDFYPNIPQDRPTGPGFTVRDLFGTSTSFSKQDYDTAINMTWAGLVQKIQKGRKLQARARCTRALIDRNAEEKKF